MNRLLFLFTLLLMSFAAGKDPGFQEELDSIVIRFDANIVDDTVCKGLKQESKVLAKSIKKYMKENQDLKEGKMEELKTLYANVTALKYYIGGLKDTGFVILPAKKFLAGNIVAKGELEYVKKGKYCAAIVKVIFDDYVCYLIENQGDKDMALRYSWKKSYEIGGGTVSLPLYAGSIQKIFDSVSHPERKDAEIFNLKCTIYPY